MRKVILLLMVATGCGSKDSPMPATASAPIFTCQLNGGAFTSPIAKAYLGIGSGGTNTNRTDVLQIIGGRGTAGAGLVSATYSRPTGGTVAAFQLSSIIYNDNSSVKTCTDNLAGTVQQNTTGGWSGTFSGDYTDPASRSTTQVRQGIFTDVQP